MHINRQPYSQCFYVVQRFFAEYEFKAPYLACCSDCEPLALSELLLLADEDGRARHVSFCFKVPLIFV
jgi:hypothetical protein